MAAVYSSRRPKQQMPKRAKESAFSEVMVGYKARASMLSSFYPNSPALGAVAATERKNLFTH